MPKKEDVDLLTKVFEKLEKGDNETVRDARVVNASLVEDNDKGEEVGKDKNISKKS